VRAVLDPNVLISALLSRAGAPARLLREWQHGGFELVLSQLALDELVRALAYPKIRQRIDKERAAAFVELLRESATLVDDPDEPPRIRSSDAGDDYLIALAATHEAAIVTGDRHLLALAGRAPVFSPADFLALVESRAR
jgi:putative PIN family toxin of toxin-antitoxin system